MPRSRVSAARVVALLTLAAACEATTPVPVSPIAPTSPQLERGEEWGDNERGGAYVIEDLGVPANMQSSFGYAINDRGDVAGAFRGPPTPPGTPRVLHAFIYTTAMEDLGLLPGTIRSTARGINNRRQVVGWTLTPPDADGIPHLQGFIWTPADGMQALPVLPGGEQYMLPTAINERGDIVGCMYLDDGFSPSHIVQWRGHDHVVEDLGTGPADGGACGLSINDRGDIAGRSGNDTPTLHAVVVRHGSYVPLGELPGEAQSIAVGINASGDVVGVDFNRFSIDPTVPFIWTKEDGLRAIPLLAGNASGGIAAINNGAVVVGGALTTRASTCQHPWVWSSKHGAPTLLPLLTGFHPEADCAFGLATQTAAINEDGVIVGQTAASTGFTHAVRWMSPREND